MKLSIYVNFAGSCTEAAATTRSTWVQRLA